MPTQKRTPAATPEPGRITVRNRSHQLVTLAVTGDDDPRLTTIRERVRQGEIEIINYTPPTA